MTADHREFRERLGAYVLGGLSPEQRMEVDRHLDSCTDCRNEVAALAPLPQLLDRLDAEEAAGESMLLPSPGLKSRVIQAAARDARRTRIQLWAWRAATAAAAVAALISWAPWETGPDALVAPARPVAAGVDGSADLMAWEWGTTVRLNLRDLPHRDGYVLWTIGEDGRREQAGTWGPTAGGQARVIGASGIQRQQIERVEVTDEDGDVLAYFEI